jgi:4-hydroxybenzoate polyprenyltransferase
MIHPRHTLSHLYGLSAIQLMFKLRLNYALVSSSLLLGGLFCNNLGGFDWGYIAIILGFFFANVFGFVINDFFDALSDCIENEKKGRNLFCSSKTKGLGKVILSTSLGLSLFFGGIVSPQMLLFIGLLNLLAFSYSAPPIKLRDRLFWDWIFVFFWKGIIIFAGYFYFFDADMSAMNPFMYGSMGIVLLVSLISQISNQIRDFEVDKKTKSNNTVQFFGFQTALFIKRTLLVIFYAFSLIFCVLLNLYITMPLILLNFSLYLFVNPGKYRYVVEYANIWILVIFLEYFMIHFNPWVIAVIWAVAVVWIVAMGRIAVIRMKHINF